MKDIDWKILLPVASIALIGGAALGAFVIKPEWDKAQAKKLAKSKGDKNKPKNQPAAKKA